MELITVLAILSVVTLIAMPRYAQAMSGYRVGHAAQRLVNDLERAREIARTRGTQVTFTIDYERDRYEIAWADESTQVDLADAPYEVNVEGQGKSESVNFNVFGDADRDLVVDITHGSNAAKVGLGANTGRAASF